MFLATLQSSQYTDSFTSKADYEVGVIVFFGSFAVFAGTYFLIIILSLRSIDKILGTRLYELVHKRNPFGAFVAITWTFVSFWTWNEWGLFLAPDRETIPPLSEIYKDCIDLSRTLSTDPFVGAMITLTWNALLLASAIAGTIQFCQFMRSVLIKK
jgi:hypothetical protein